MGGSLRKSRAPPKTTLDSDQLVEFLEASLKLDMIRAILKFKVDDLQKLEEIRALLNLKIADLFKLEKTSPLLKLEWDDLLKLQVTSTLLTLEIDDLVKLEMITSLLEVDDLLDLQMTSTFLKSEMISTLLELERDDLLKLERDAWLKLELISALLELEIEYLLKLERDGLMKLEMSRDLNLEVINAVLLKLEKDDLKLDMIGPLLKLDIKHLLKVLYKLAALNLESQRTSLKKSHAGGDDDLDRYDLSGRRKAFLMCVKKNRPGADGDVLLMQQWLGQCQFEYTLCIDPGKEELLEKLTSFRDGLNEIKDEMSCCLVTLMSHGGKGYLITGDGHRVMLEEVFEMFNNKNCPALHEKPKIFIIQACRGPQRDNGVETDDEFKDLGYDDCAGSDSESEDSDYKSVSADSKSEDPGYESEDSECEFVDLDCSTEKRRLPILSDHFTVYSTLSDHVALRHPRTGSVMIQAMTEVFAKYGRKCHLADFFTKVNDKVVHMEFLLHKKPIKVTLVIESTLTRSVYF